jgi:glutathione peroxidase
VWDGVSATDNFRSCSDNFTCDQAFPTTDALSTKPRGTEFLEKFGESCEVNFPMFGRITASGHNAHPLFHWLRAEVTAPSYPTHAEMEFTRFLVVKGMPWKRYTAEDSVSKIEADVAHALHKVNDANSAPGVDVHLNDFPQGGHGGTEHHHNDAAPQPTPR